MKIQENSQDWNNVKFENGLLANAEYELLVVDYGSRQVLVDGLSTRPIAKEKVQTLLKEIKKEEGKNEPKTLEVSFEGRGGLKALILMGECSTYVLHESLRKFFTDTLKPDAGKKESKNINLTLQTQKRSFEILSAFASLSILSRYRPQTFGKKQADEKEQQSTLIGLKSTLSKKEMDQALQEGRVLGFYNNQTKYLAELPSNILTPKNYHEYATQKIKELKKTNSNLQASFIDVKELKKRGAGAFLAVASADLNDSAGIVHLSWKGSKKAKNKIALVGKGICFDTGGYNVKTGNYMYSMHRDMTGSAVVFSLFCTLIELEAPYEIDCYMALAENLISHEGYKPNDVVIASNGVSIEVADTDAEGRMVLSDTLAIASQKNPDLMIDFATLTGTVIRSLDTRRSGAFSNQLKVSRLAVDVGEECGERVWNFPIGDDYLKPVQSEIADVRQCATVNQADHIYAATFLSHFVGKDIPWLHIDLSSESNKGGLGLVPSEVTGFGVRFGYNFIKEFLK